MIYLTSETTLNLVKQTKYWYIIDLSTLDKEIFISRNHENTTLRKGIKFRTENEALEYIRLNGWGKWAGVIYH